MDQGARSSVTIVSQRTHLMLLLSSTTGNISLFSRHHFLIILIRKEKPTGCRLVARQNTCYTKQVVAECLNVWFQ